PPRAACEKSSCHGEQTKNRYEAAAACPAFDASSLTCGAPNGKLPFSRFFGRLNSTDARSCARRLLPLAGGQESGNLRRELSQGSGAVAQGGLDCWTKLAECLVVLHDLEQRIVAEATRPTRLEKDPAL